LKAEEKCGILKRFFALRKVPNFI
jgi:hypothetical protein